MWLTIGGESIHEGERPLSELLGDERVSTSGPAPGEFQEAIESHLGDDGVLVLTIAASMSGTHEAATIAAGQLGDRVRVVDTATAAGAEALVVLAAAAAAERGASLDEVEAEAKDVAERVQLVASVPSLDHLVRSGRVPGIAGWAGRRLRINPLFEFRGGRVHRLRPALSGDAATDRMVGRLLRSREPNTRLHVAALHALAPGAAEGVLERVEAEVTPATKFVGEFGSVMVVHTGPGLYGLAWWWEPDGRDDYYRSRAHRGVEHPVDGVADRGDGLRGEGVAHGGHDLQAARLVRRLRRARRRRRRARTGRRRRAGTPPAPEPSGPARSAARGSSSAVRPARPSSGTPAARPTRVRVSPAASTPCTLRGRRHCAGQLTDTTPASPSACAAYRKRGDRAHRRADEHDVFVALACGVHGRRHVVTLEVAERRVTLGRAVAARVVTHDVDAVGVERFRHVAHGGVVGRCGEAVHEDDGRARCVDPQPLAPGEDDVVGCREQRCRHARPGQLSDCCTHSATSSSRPGIGAGPVTRPRR